MAWTYSQDPSSSQRDYIRFLIGDTISSEGRLTDEEIEAVIGLYDSNYEIAAICCEAIAGRVASTTDSWSGDGISVSNSAVQDRYLKLAQWYRTLHYQMYGSVAAPNAGGIEITEKAAAAVDTSRVPDLFEVGQFDHPENRAFPWR